MKFKNSKKPIIFLLFLSVQYIVAERIQPKCSSSKIEYPIYANITEYLANENNIDGRKFYSSYEDLQSKKVGTLSFNSFPSFSDVEKFNSYEEVIQALREHKIEAIITDYFTATYIQLMTNDLSKISGEFGQLNFAISCRNNLTELCQSLRELVTLSANRTTDLYKIYGINEDVLSSNTTLTGDKGTLIVSLMKFPPFYFQGSFDEYGVINQLVYTVARQLGYKLKFVEPKTLEEYLKAIKNHEYDIYGFLDEKNEIPHYDLIVLNKPAYNLIVRYSDLAESAEWEIINEAEQLNGDDLGCLNKYSFEYLYEEKFPDSKIKYFDNNFDLLYQLLYENIDGFLTDETIAKNFKNKFPNRITYYDMGVSNDFGFGFKKGDDSLLKEFNEFLKKIDVDALFEKWTVFDTTNLFVEKNNYEGGKTIKVGLFLDSKPFCYLEQSKEKGFDVDLLYQFAKSKNYNIEITEINAAERLEIERLGLDITAGAFTITEERAELVTFSNPIIKVGTSFVVRKDCKFDEVELNVLDKEYKKKSNNKANIYAKVGKKTVTSVCKFPNFYNETLLIKCTINDFNGTDPYNEGIESISTDDKLMISFSHLEIDNLLKANDKLNLPIIQESDKSEAICPANYSTITKIVLALASLVGMGSIFGLLGLCL